jgi:hypothetical protein
LLYRGHGVYEINSYSSRHKQSIKVRAHANTALSEIEMISFIGFQYPLSSANSVDAQTDFAFL